MTLLSDLNTGVTVPVTAGGTIPSAIPAKAHSIRLRNILVQVLPDEVYAGSTKEDRVYPDCVYRIGGSTVIESMHTVIGGESIFLVTIRDRTYDGVATVADAISLLIESETGIEIIDSASDYSDKHELHEIALEVVINTPGGDFDGNGSVIMIDGSCKSNPSHVSNCAVQVTYCQKHFVIQVKDQGTLDTTKAELQSVLLGYTEGQTYTPMEHISGQPLKSSGGLKAWVETYQSGHTIHD